MLRVTIGSPTRSGRRPRAPDGRGPLPCTRARQPLLAGPCRSCLADVLLGVRLTQLVAPAPLGIHDLPDSNLVDDGVAREAAQAPTRARACLLYTSPSPRDG